MLEQERAPSSSSKELADLINRNWFVESPGGTREFPPRWRFEDDLRTLTDEALCLLLRIHAIRKGWGELAMVACRSELERIRDGSSATIGTHHMATRSVVETLKAIALAEFRVDDLLLHPPKMRKTEMQELSSLVGMSVADFTSFVTSWFSELRILVYGTEGSF